MPVNLSPFKLTGPTCLSFSGGRTSAYMLWLVLQANTREDIERWLVDQSYPTFWIKAERMVQSSAAVTGDGARFRNDRESYEDMLHAIQAQPDMFGHDLDAELAAAAGEPGIDCFCGD